MAGESERRPSLVPFTLTAAEAGPDLPPAVAARGQIIPLDIMDGKGGKLAVGMIEVQPLESVVLTPCKAPAAVSGWAKIGEQNGALVVRGPAATVRFADGALAGVALPGNGPALTLAEAPVVGARASVISTGTWAPVVRLAPDNERRDYWIYRNGLIAVRAGGKYRLDCPQGSEWFSYKPTVGLGLTRITGTNVFHWHSQAGNSSMENYASSQFPCEWLVLQNMAEGPGLWVKSDSPETTVAVVFSRHKSVSFAATSGGVRVWLRPVRTAADGKPLYLASAPPLLCVRKDGPRFAGQLPYAIQGAPIRFEVEDRDGNGPDLRADRWSFFIGDRLNQAWQFSDSPDGATCSIFADYNKDGTLDDLEQKVRFMTMTDSNHDRRYIFGPLLFGGFLVNDRYEGSRRLEALDPFPDVGARRWISTVTAFRTYSA